VNHDLPDCRQSEAPPAPGEVGSRTPQRRETRLAAGQQTGWFRPIAKANGPSETDAWAARTRLPSGEVTPAIEWMCGICRLAAAERRSQLLLGPIVDVNQARNALILAVAATHFRVSRKLEPIE